MAIESSLKGRAGPPLGHPRGASDAAEDPSWLIDLVSLLRSQDNAYFSRKHIMSLSAEHAPLVVKHRASASQGLTYILLAADTAVSLKAAALLRALLRDQDKLIVAHFVRQHAQAKQALDGFMRQYQVLCHLGWHAWQPAAPSCQPKVWHVLAAFDRIGSSDADPALLNVCCTTDRSMQSRQTLPSHGKCAYACDAICMCCVADCALCMQEEVLLTKRVELLCESRGDTPLTTMVQDLVSSRSADMLVIPTDTYGQHSSAGKEAVGSMSATLLRNIKDVSLLLVKANSVGNAHKSSPSQSALSLRGSSCCSNIWHDTT